MAVEVSQTVSPDLFSVLHTVSILDNKQFSSPRTYRVGSIPWDPALHGSVVSLGFGRGSKKLAISSFSFFPFWVHV